MAGAKAAIQEIKQLLAERGDGTVWIDYWRQRYGTLAESPREFMESRPDIFEVTMTGEGNKYTVALAAGVKAASPKGKGKGKAPMLALGNGTAGAKGGGAGAVIQEIKQQLAARGDGTVWIDNWRQRYGTLAASPREFMESRPDIFEVTMTGEGNKFTVALAAGVKKPASSKVWIASPKVSVSGGGAGTVAQAVAEAKAQLSDPSNTEGKVWIDNWNQRFGHLGMTIRELLESRPDLFQIMSLGGTRFCTTLRGGKGAGKGASKGGKGGHWVFKPASGTPMTPAVTSGVKRKATDAPGNAWKLQKGAGTEDQAIKEITAQLKHPKNTEGKVWIDGWKSRYGGLNVSLRELLDMHPEKFNVIPGDGNKFTVELVF